MERWFATASRCESAAEAARAKLAADGREMLSLGIHVPLYFAQFWAEAPR